MDNEAGIEGITPFTPEAILEALERGRADIAAGRTYDLEEFLRELEAEDAAEAVPDKPAAHATK